MNTARSLPRRSRRGIAIALTLGAMLSFIIPASAAFATEPFSFTVGSRPYGLAMNGQQLYIVNQGGQYLSAAKPGYGAIQRRNPAQSIAGPSQVAVSPDGVSAYVTGETTTGDGFVSVVDTASLAVTTAVQVGQNPRALAISPNGDALYVANKDSNSVALIALPSLHLVRYITVGHAPSAIAFSPFGDYVYVANLDSDSVSVINTATQAVEATVQVGNGPSAIAVSSDGLLAYTANELDGTVSSIDTRSRQAGSFSVGGSPWAIALSSDGDRAYLSNSAKHSVIVADLRKRMVTTTVATPGTPGILVFDSDSQILWVANTDAGSVTGLMVPTAAAPQDETAKDGAKVEFYSQVGNRSGVEAWQVSADKGKTWHTVAGSDNDSVRFTATKAESGNLYRLHISDPSYGDIYSAQAGLTVTGSDGGGGTSTIPTSTPAGTSAPVDVASGDVSASSAGIFGTSVSPNWLIIALAVAILLAIALAVILIVITRRRARSD